MTECQICADKYNKSTKKPIKCLFCSESCCKECVIGNIKSNWDSNPRHCLFCKEDWDIQFWCENFYKKEIDDHFKSLAYKRAIDLEHSRLSEFQEKAITFKSMNEKKAQMESNKVKISKLKAEIEMLKNENGALFEDVYDMNQFLYHGAASASDNYSYSIKCPGENCKYMLNKKYFCEFCSKQYCDKCLVCVETDNHECDKDTLETIKEIKKNSKPCPGCGTSISKVDGCDQMWCIICKKGFSWRTGQIETGRIHNPEYFRWVQEHGQVEEETNEVPERHNNCVFPALHFYRGALATLIDIRNAFLIEYFMNAFRFGLHLDVMIEGINTNENNKDTRILNFKLKYLINEMTSDEFNKVIVAEEIQSMKAREVSNIHQLVKIVILENCWVVVDAFNNNPGAKYKNIELIMQIKSKLDKIKDYANEAYAKISSQKMHGGKKYHIYESWSFYQL